jgi:hypothetical protein
MPFKRIRSGWWLWSKSNSIQNGQSPVMDILSLAKTECPSFQLKPTRRNHPANRQVIEFTFIKFSFLSPSFWPINCLLPLALPCDAMNR